MKTIFDNVEYSPWIKGLMTPMLGVDGTRLRASASGLGAQHERLPGQAWLVAGSARPERGCGSHLRESDRASCGQPVPAGPVQTGRDPGDRRARSLGGADQVNTGEATRMGMPAKNVYGSDYGMSQNA